MFKVSLDETVDLPFEADPSRFRRRVLHPNGCELINV